MPIIRFKKPRPPIDVPTESNLMKALLDASIPVASSCKGDGVCAKCRIEVIEGPNHLSTPNERELFLKERHSVPKNQRISCQTLVLGDITVDASYW